MATIYVATTGNDSTGDGSSGNPYATPGKAASVMAAGDTVDVSAGTYVMTTASTNVAGGCISDSRNSYGVVNKWIGHGTVIFQAGTGVTSVYLMNLTGRRIYVENITADSNNKTGVNGFYSSGLMNVFYKCTSINSTSYGFNISAENYLYRCIAKNNTGYGFQTASGCFFWCVSRNNTSDGYYGSTNTQVFENCISYNNGGWGYSGVSGCLGQIVRSCIAYGNSSGGFNNSGWLTNGPSFAQGGRQYIFDACIAYGNSGYGFLGDTTDICHNCADGLNTSGGYSGLSQQINCVSLTADPFVSASTGDFNLNTAAGGGALLSAVNFSMPW